MASWTKWCEVSIFQVSRYFMGGRGRFTMVQCFLSLFGEAGYDRHDLTARHRHRRRRSNHRYDQSWQSCMFPPNSPCPYLSPPPRLLSPSFFKNRFMTCLPPVVSRRLTQQTGAPGKHPGLPPSVGLRLPLPLQSVSMATATTRTTNCLALAMAGSVSA